MSRPSPEILASACADTGMIVDVLATEKTYAVTYHGRTISLRVDPCRYRRIFFAHPAHAHREAKRMNELFGGGFTVREMVLA